jgi:hypothetical protein
MASQENDVTQTWDVDRVLAAPDTLGAPAYVSALIEKAAAIRMPDLFGDQPHALYAVANRNGVAVVALRTRDLSDEQLVQFMTYRLAQYLVAGFVDLHMAYERQLDHEPLAYVSSDDVHVIAGNAVTGELLCYLTIEAVGGEAAPVVTLRDRDRPLIALEEAHGYGIFNRLRVLPDLPLQCIREIGRFAKNQRLPKLDELAVRAPVETLIAVYHLLTGPLLGEVDAIVGQAEEEVVLQNLAFLQLPLAVIHGTVAYADEAAYMCATYIQHNHFPFAFHLCDLPRIATRVVAIEQALALRGKQAILSLLRLKRDAKRPLSLLEPVEGLPALDRIVLQERRAAMPERRRLLDMGEWLRSIDLFQDLSLGEATVLGTLLERVEVKAGSNIVAQGTYSDGLYLVEDGVATRRVRAGAQRMAPLAQHGPGAYCGEVGLLTGAPNTADVIAQTPMRLLHLRPEVYAQYLAPLPDVRLRLAEAAARRAAEDAHTSAALRNPARAAS